jgi:formate-dependent nitrite reductase membrane component NrfD
MPQPWGWKVSAYLWTKSIAAGALLVPALAVLAGLASPGFLLGAAPPVIALLFLAITTGLLVFDLKRPDRFHYILFKGNRTSWLVWGAWILMAYGVVAMLWLVGVATGSGGLVRALALPAVLLAAAAAGYSAFLFGQAEGRDFWQSPLLLPQLLVAALAAGAASLLVVGVIAAAPDVTLHRLRWILAGALVAQATLLIAELGATHANLDVARAGRLITRGHFRGAFWGGVVVAGIALPLVLLSLGASGGLVALAAVLALAGLAVYEDVWVKAGQSIPLS